MNIIQITNKYFTKGGVEAVAEFIYEKFGGRVYVFNDSGYTDSLNNESLIVSKLNLTIAGQSIPLSYEFYFKILKDFRSSDKIIIHTPTVSALICLFFTDPKKTIIYQHSRSYGPKGWLLTWCIRSIAKYRAISIYYTGLAEALLNKSAPHKYIRLPLVGNSTKGSHISSQNYDLIFVGRLVPYKGLIEFFRMVAESKYYKLKIAVVGDGPLRQNLSILCSDLGLNVEFLGELTNEMKTAVLKNSKGLILPSLDAREAFGLVQLEAFQAGIPAIVKSIPAGTCETSIVCPDYVHLYYDTHSFEQAITAIFANDLNIELPLEFSDSEIIRAWSLILND